MIFNFAFHKEFLAGFHFQSFLFVSGYCDCERGDGYSFELWLKEDYPDRIFWHPLLECILCIRNSLYCSENMPDSKDGYSVRLFLPVEGLKPFNFDLNTQDVLIIINILKMIGKET